MSAFASREKAFEKQLAYAEDFKFRVNARRNKLLAMWAAEKMGKNHEEAKTYAMQMIMLDLERDRRKDVLGRVSEDFESMGLSVPHTEIRATMNILADEARRQLMS